MNAGYLFLLENECLCKAKGVWFQGVCVRIDYDDFRIFLLFLIVKICLTRFHFFIGDLPFSTNGAVYEAIIYEHPQIPLNGSVCCSKFLGDLSRCYCPFLFNIKVDRLNSRQHPGSWLIQKTTPPYNMTIEICVARESWSLLLFYLSF